MGLFSSIFGSSGGSKPWQSSQFGQQNDMLSNYLMGNFANSYGMNSTPSFQGTGVNTQLNNPYNSQASGASVASNYGDYGFMSPAVQSFQASSQPSMPSTFKTSFSQPQQGFTQAGQDIAGYGFTPFSQTGFQERTPFQFSDIQSIDVGDTFTPQYELAKRFIDESQANNDEKLLSSLNKRGLLTTGATTQALNESQTESNRRLDDLGSRFATEQARAQLAEDQMRRAMEQQRQMAQAEELFRQSGASDAQAQFLAQQNLADRNQLTSEEVLANQFRRQPLEDLFRMWQQQTGQVTNKGSSGIGGLLGGIAGGLASGGISKLFS